MRIEVATSDLLTVAQAAEAAGMKLRTVYHRIHKGRIIAVRLGGTLFVPASEVERLKENSAKENSKGGKNETITNGDLGNTGARGKKR